MGDAEQGQVRERPVEAADRGRPVGPVRDQLRQHRVVVGADHAAGRDPGVDADAGALRQGQLADRPDRGQEAGRGILGVEARLDRVAGRARARPG